ncbi:hypothetical protein J421_4475 [Gemmatirosa kalamazoonensis]|uniref:Uncharacterized protein n=1 Tax=Gemmatirosa kalamazoonensis TaxID=861299 RepID=W0RND6_9BACT|nr:hypothetical protein [Gemmatirosa kalamazoonensis]AHG92012.1 hypothetical protein J421_4475 [Gemmatirosa kalamazoonensis]
MLLMLSILIALAIAFVGFRLSRRFVRDRLRFVDAAQRTSAPWLAGIGALVLGAVVVALIPGLSVGTAVAFALAIGTGVAAGARDVREGRHLLDDGR